VNRIFCCCRYVFLNITCAATRGGLIRIFLVDDSEIARAAVKALLHQRSEWIVVGEAFNGRHAIETFLDHMPHLTVMDSLMPVMNGLEAARHLTQRHPDVLILMITSDPSRELEIEARRAGIKGVCAKSQMHCLFKAVDAVMGGGTYFSEDAAA
jgi:DNA-binding NarL/FixJ family response regulator